MTVYKAIKPEADGRGADGGRAGQRQAVPANMVTTKINNGTTDVPSDLLTPVAVTKDNVKDTTVVTVKERLLDRGQICTPRPVRLPGGRDR